MFYYIYILKSNKDGKLYTGLTNDLRKRFFEHNSNLVTSTKSRGPFALIYYEACLNRHDAALREKYLKSGMGKRYLRDRLKRFLSLTGQVQNGACPVRSRPPTVGETSNGGYIVLTSVIIISVILIAITVALSYVNYFSRFNVLQSEYKEKSASLAEACVAYAKTRLAGNSSYSPNNDQVLISPNSNDACSVVSITNVPPNKVIKTQSQYQKAVTTYSVTINVSTFAVVSFIENPN